MGLSLTAIGGASAFIATYHLQREAEVREAELHAVDIAGTLRAGLEAPVEALYALQAFMEMPRSGLTHAQFRAFCRSAVERHESMAALEWFPFVNSSQRQAFEEWVAEEQPGFQVREPTRGGDMVAAVPRRMHLPLTYSEPRNPAVHGLDIAFEAQRIEPARKALESGQATLSHRYSLVEDDDEVLSVVAYAPVTRASWVGDPERAAGRYERGVVVALFRLNQVIETALSSLDLSEVELMLTDPAAPPELRLLYRTPGAGDGLASAAAVPFADKTYELTVYTRSKSYVYMPWFALLVALGIGGSLTLFADARRRAVLLERTVERLGVYRLEGRIASGGMGTVYKAHHALLKRPTAIKIAKESELSSNFEKEVRLTSALSHPNTVMVYDFGKGKDGSFYYAMEYIEGYDLEQLVATAGPLSAGRALRLLLQITASLQEAHEMGMVHRDIKPSNIMVTERGGVKDFIKVLDFGLAKQQAALKPVVSQASLGSISFAGTPGYVAPEVISGGSTSVLADVFSLGCVAYFLLSGQGPFTGRSATESLTLVLTKEASPLPARVPEELDRVVRCCLCRDVAQRPQSMRALAEQLRNVMPHCHAWTQRDVDAWWKEHPPRSSLVQASGSLTFFLRQRGSRASNESETSSVDEV